jgi:hypothetical protein
MAMIGSSRIIKTLNTTKVQGKKPAFSEDYNHLNAATLNTYLIGRLFVFGAFTVEWFRQFELRYKAADLATFAALAGPGPIALTFLTEF